MKKIARILWGACSSGAGAAGLVTAGFFYNHGSSLAVGVAALLVFLSLNSLAYGWHLIFKKESA